MRMGSARHSTWRKVPCDSAAAPCPWHAAHLTVCAVPIPVGSSSNAAVAWGLNVGRVWGSEATPAKMVLCSGKFAKVSGGCWPKWSTLTFIFAVFLALIAGWYVHECMSADKTRVWRLTTHKMLLGRNVHYCTYCFYQYFCYYSW